MNGMIVVVGLRQIALVQEQSFETIKPTQLINLVHLDRIEWANLHANLAAHAYGDIDVENARMFLRLTLFIALENNIDALWRTFLFADLAGNTAKSFLWIAAVMDQKWKIAGVLLQQKPLLGILNRG